MRTSCLPNAGLPRALVLSIVVVLWAAAGMAAEISRFVGSYSGSAVVEQADGASFNRDMSVEISATKNGFRVEWSAINYRDGERGKEKSYSIDFVASDREGVYAAAMRRNVFGHEVQLDPMKGEPYVWSRIDGDTLSVFSLFVHPDGGYEMQQFDRTLAEGGLQLEFSRLSNGVPQRAVTTFLSRN